MFWVTRTVDLTIDNAVADTTAPCFESRVSAADGLSPIQYKTMHDCKLAFIMAVSSQALIES